MTTDWNHFVAVYDASINKITYYMNNIAVASINPTGTAMYTDMIVLNRKNSYYYFLPTI
jgi:hypothetical protein